MNINSNKDFLAEAAEAGVDVINGGGLMINSTLRHEEHLAFDDALLKVTRQGLNGVMDLINAGLTVDLGDMGTTMSFYERSGDMTAPEINMDGATEDAKDRVTFDQVGVPIPVYSKSFTIFERQLLASRTRGESLDTTQLEICGELIAQELEKSLFNGVSGIEIDGSKIYGYTNHPERNTVSLAGSGWATASGRSVVNDTVNMLQAMYDDNRMGPFTMYVAKNIWVQLQTDYTAHGGSNETFIQRILSFNEIVAVKAGNTLAAGNVVLVELSKKTVDLAVAQDVVNVQWSTNPLAHNFKVYCAMAARVKSDKDGKCGIVHAS